jgi:hypothetical protein
VNPAGAPLGAPHCPGMAEPHDKIKINPQPLRVGNEWHVRAIWPSGHPEEITGFKTEEARDWINGEGAKVWLRERGYSDK